MKNIALYIGIALIVAGAVVGQFTGVEATKWVELVGFAAGLATCVISLVKKTEKKDWRLWTAIGCVVVGTFALIAAGVAEATITTIVSTVVGVVALIVGIVTAVFAAKKPAELEEVK